mmetsp:Transcript_15519/g.18663  ORF Transcript_15519/g.18663 Transcript_15519/m.18663 type:complete len:94 (-) Transcript_15519:335-616(-)
MKNYRNTKFIKIRHRSKAKVVCVVCDLWKSHSHCDILCVSARDARDLSCKKGTTLLIKQIESFLFQQSQSPHLAFPPPVAILSQLDSVSLSFC